MHLPRCPRLRCRRLAGGGGRLDQVNADAEREHVSGEQLPRHRQEHPLTRLRRAAGQSAAAHVGRHEDQLVLVDSGELHGELAPEPRRHGRGSTIVRPDAHQRHGGGLHAELAQGHEEHAPVVFLLADEDVPAPRQGEAQVTGPAVADRDGGARVVDGDVVEKHGAGAEEGAAGLRARAGRAGTRAAVARGFVVHDVALAAEHLVGARHLGGANDDVQLAAVGVGAAADVAVAAPAVAAQDVPGRAALRSETQRTQKSQHSSRKRVFFNSKIQHLSKECFFHTKSQGSSKEGFFSLRNKFVIFRKQIVIFAAVR